MSNLFHKAEELSNKLFSKSNGKILFRKAENTGRNIIDGIVKHSNLIGQLAPVAVALGQPEIAVGLSAISKYAPQIKSALG